MSGLESVTPDPPSPFLPLDFRVPEGTLMHRVYPNGYASNEFNPGPNGAGRFSFFGDPQVSVLYCAESEEAAVAETLLRNVPIKGGSLQHRVYRDRVMAGLVTTRDLSLASFMGPGLRALQVDAYELTDTPGETNYPQTRKWAAAAHAAGFDGIVWMSRRMNNARCFMFFGDRVSPADFVLARGTARVFAAGPDLDWLIRVCLPMRITVLQDPGILGA